MTTDADKLPEPTEEEIESLKAKHGTVHLLGNEFGQAVFRLPTLKEYNRFREEMAMGAQYKASSGPTLVRACVVWPDRKAFDAIVAAHPGIIDTMAGELVEHAGAKAATTNRKL